MKEIYQNHAGCERGYFILPDNSSISLPKKDNTGNNLYIPDLILYDQVNNIILLIEGKKLNTLNLGLQDIENYNSIENEFIKVYYRNTEIKRYLTIFGGNIKQFSLTNFEKVLLYISENGEIKLNRNIPNNIFYTLKNSLLKLSSKK